MALYKGNKKIAGLIRSEDISHATETHAGVIEIATQGEVLGGASDTKAVTPTKLKQYYYNKVDTNDLLNTKQNKLIAGENINIDPDTNTISSTGGQGASEFSQLLGSPYDNENLKNALDSKQNTIDDLDTIRSGAELGSTALQSYTETDPVYLADKPSIALKSEIPSLEGYATEIYVQNYHDLTKQDVIDDLEQIRINAQTGADIVPQVNSNTQRIEDLTVSKFPNATPIGKPQVQDSYVSGFSDSIYMIFPFTDISRGLPFDIYFSFTTGSDVITQQNILDSYFGMALAIANGKGLMAISTNGTNWESGSIVGSNTINPNTTYYAKLSWTGTQYTTALSTDDQTYIPDMVYNNSNSPNKTTIYIGSSPNIFGPNSAHPFKGTINFKGARVYLPTLGINVWEGMADVGLGSRANVSLNNLDEVGESRFNAKQNITDNTLTTTNKTIVGAINELNTKPSGAKVTFRKWGV